MEFKLKELLKEKNISGYKLAKMLEIDTNTVYRWINNIFVPSTKNLYKICEVLDCKIDDIVKKA